MSFVVSVATVITAVAIVVLWATGRRKQHIRDLRYLFLLLTVLVATRALL
jgi:hypothetical protein